MLEPVSETTKTTDTQGNVSSLPARARKIVSEFIDRITGIEPPFVDGVYIIGSLALNDFYSNKSDIDFIILCKALPDKNIAIKLKRIHKHIGKSFPKPDLSGIYLTLDCLQSKMPEDSTVLIYHEGSLHYGKSEMAPIALSELSSHGLTILGQRSETLPVNITNSQVTRFLYENINSYWQNWIDHHASYFHRRILLLFFPRMTEWSVLGVARQFYTLQTGRIVSKTEAGIYCLQHLPERFHPIITEAISIRQDNRTYPFVKSYAISPSFSRCAQTIDCVNYMITLFNERYLDKGHSTV
jgi:hypothetical protein